MRAQITYIFLALVLFATGSLAHAASRYTVETRITEKGKTIVGNEVITIDGNRARIDVLGASTKVTEKTPYMLTTDGGKNWYVVDEKDRFCAEVETEKFFSELGIMGRRVGKLVAANISTPQIKVVFNKPGPKMLGEKTRHVKLVRTLGANARFFSKKYEYSGELVNEIWYAESVPVNPIRKKWISAISNTGVKELDELLQGWVKTVKGAVIKEEKTLVLIDKTKKQKDTFHEVVEVKTVEEIPGSKIGAGTFKVPVCTSDETSVTNAAKKLFSMGQASM
jgi:hypothetical protein